MHLHSFRIKNFRRLKDAHIDLDRKSSIFVGSNNSGKTSATLVFQLFLGSSRFSIHDFSADCWAIFNDIGSSASIPGQSLPTIGLDLWFDVNASDLHRVIKLLPGLDWSDTPVGVRMEFAPKDATELLTRFHEANHKAGKFAVAKQQDKAGYHPWPETLTDYLTKRLDDEYKVFYYVLDRSEFDAEFREKNGYVPQELGDGTESGGAVIKSLLKVDFLHAQRHLSDTESKGRAEDLSRRLNRFYERNLQKHDHDFEAVSALARAEAQLNDHLAAVFEPTLKSLNSLGYPGFAEPDLVIKSAFDSETMLTQNASVHYALRDPGKSVAVQPYLTLPDKYNGLGFKNLIYIVIELLDFHQRWSDDEEGRPPVHLIIIEEPEAHLHAQLQQVFIRKIMEILPNESPLFNSQLIVTTHSPHIIYESSFAPVRYFRRSSHAAGYYTDVLNLSNFSPVEEDTRKFLFQYMKLTHCDLFFADAAVLVEGNVERLLLPLMIEQVAPQLQSSYLSILELGGAFAHVFRNLIHFLGLPTLVITDLDSVVPTPEKTPKAGDKKAGSAAEHSAADDDEDMEEAVESAAVGVCRVHVAGAVTSNQTLIKWLPRLKSIADLLAAKDDIKSPAATPAEPATVRVAYQTIRPVAWNKEQGELAGRTFEEAFAYENLAWCQDIHRSKLGLRVTTKTKSLPLVDVAEKIHIRVKSNHFDKTGFALALMMEEPTEWAVPHYIAEGLLWLGKQLIATEVEIVATPVEPAAAPVEPAAIPHVPSATTVDSVAVPAEPVAIAAAPEMETR